MNRSIFDDKDRPSLVDLLCFFSRGSSQSTKRSGEEASRGAHRCSENQWEWGPDRHSSGYWGVVSCDSNQMVVTLYWFHLKSCTFTRPKMTRVILNSLKNHVQYFSRAKISNLHVRCAIVNIDLKERCREPIARRDSDMAGWKLLGTYWTCMDIHIC